MSILPRFDAFFEKHVDIGLLILRLFIAGRLLYGVIDNVLSWERMLEFADFLAIQNFPWPIGSAVLSVYVQLIGGLCLLLGAYTRIAAAILSLNFLVALVFVHLSSGDSVEGMTPAMAMLFGSLTLLFTGPGKWSVRD